MASFHDILTEVMDTTFAQEQLKKMEDELQQVMQASQSDPTLATKTASLSVIPQQIKGLKAWLEQQKKATESGQENKEDQQKELGKGVGTQTSLSGQAPKPTGVLAGQQLNPPSQAQAKPKAIDQLRTTNLTKK
jgi:hypothetical protein